jgi:predicted deacetylase
MVGYQGRLFKIEENFQVLAERRNYMAVGSGESIALGVLYATEEKDPVTRVLTAMKASAAFNAWVREPFEILHLPYAEDWHQSARAKAKGSRKKSIGKGK